MRKIVLTWFFSILFMDATMAAENESAMPLTSTMDDNMRMMVSTNIAYLGKELQLRATDLYIMGEGLLSHTTHPKCQTDGKKAIDLAKRLYQVGQELIDGKEITPKDMENFVNRWTKM